MCLVAFIPLTVICHQIHMFLIMSMIIGSTFILMKKDAQWDISDLKAKVMLVIIFFSN